MDITYNDDHLHKEAKHVIHLEKRERIEFANQARWINHQACALIRNRMKSLTLLPQIDEALCCIIVGEGGVGKSSLMRRIAKDCNNLAQRKMEGSIHVEFRVGADPTLVNVIGAICEKFGTSGFNPRKDDIPPELVLLIRARGIKILLIDEIQHVLVANRTEQKKILSFFKNLSGPPVSLSIIATGTQEALNAITSESPLKSRFQVFELLRWTDGEELRAFLASYEQFLPLKLPSNLASQEIVHFFLTSFDPTTRQIVNRLKWATMLALLEGTEKIELDNLTRANLIPDITEAYL
jgi:chromosomal replication initiation ATPase DnaA